MEKFPVSTILGKERITVVPPKTEIPNGYTIIRVYYSPIIKIIKQDHDEDLY